MKLSKGVWVGLSLLHISPVLLASPNEAIIDGLSRCLLIASNEQRLTCYDQLSTKNSQVFNAENMKDKTILSVEIENAEQAKKVANFSKQDLKKTDQEHEPTSITAIVAKVKKLIRGQWVVDLENGQQWQQQDTARMKLTVGDHIRLTKGSLGVVYLVKEGSNRSIRVKRLK